MKPKNVTPITSNHKDYHLMSCGGESIMRLFPSRRDESEKGEEWLERMLKRLSEQMDEENNLQQALEIGLKQIEPQRLWVLLNVPENISKSHFYEQATLLLTQELGLNAPSPAPRQNGPNQGFRSSPQMSPTK